MIRYKLGFLAASVMAAALALGVGCDWSGGSGSDSFNTSRGASVNLNFSGVYDGLLSGGRAVAKTSNGNITRLVLTQSGNSVEVIDNQGSKYTGNVGSPGAIAEPTDSGAYPVGATIAESQITFSGKDGVAGKDIEFVGVMSLVAVVDIKGNSSFSSSGSTNSSSRSSSDAETTTLTQSINNGSNTVVTTTVTIGVPTDPFYQQTVTTVTIDNATGAEVGRTITKTGNSNSGSGSSSGQTKTTTFQITEQNTQVKLEGTWVEKGGVVSGVEALSSGGVGFVSTQAPVDGGTDTTAQ